MEVKLQVDPKCSSYEQQIGLDITKQICYTGHLSSGICLGDSRGPLISTKMQIPSRHFSFSSLILMRGPPESPRQDRIKDRKWAVRNASVITLQAAEPPYSLNSGQI